MTSVSCAMNETVASPLGGTHACANTGEVAPSRRPNAKPAHAAVRSWGARMRLLLLTRARLCANLHRVVHHPEELFRFVRRLELAAVAKFGAAGFHDGL